MDKNYTRRYAVYYAPEEGSGLHAFGRRWLGRDAATGEPVRSYSIAGISGERFGRLTEAPRRYGFHGTLKPPFHLVDGAKADEIHAAVGSLAMEIRPFSVGPLELRWLGRFLALTPSEPGRELHDLAAECVRRLDGFRAPPSEEELAGRRASGLTRSQERLLERWGYPYVMEEFRFHLTLTGPMSDQAEMDLVFSSAELLTSSFRRLPLEISSICVFQQEYRDAPFRLTQRFRFGEPCAAV